MSETKAGRSLVKGLVAGLVAGVVATAAKSCVEVMFPPRVHGEPDPPEALAERVAGHHLDRKTRSAAGTAIHWGFGAAVGAAYGVVAEYYPAATDRQGATFGLALMSFTHKTSLPAMELAVPVEEQSFRERSSEATSHLVYGVVAETVRGVVRRML